MEIQAIFDFHQQAVFVIWSYYCIKLWDYSITLVLRYYVVVGFVYCVNQDYSVVRKTRIIKRRLLFLIIICTLLNGFSMIVAYTVANMYRLFIRLDRFKELIWVFLHFKKLKKWPWSDHFIKMVDLDFERAGSNTITVEYVYLQNSRRLSLISYFIRFL